MSNVTLSGLIQHRSGLVYNLGLAVKFFTWLHSRPSDLGRRKLEVGLIDGSVHEQCTTFADKVFIGF